MFDEAGCRSQALSEHPSVSWAALAELLCVLNEISADLREQPPYDHEQIHDPKGGAHGTSQE
ncbi:MAG: hypothetical protein ACF8NJ_01010, partial [Phycisphaerales bacterium JB038]